MILLSAAIVLLSLSACGSISTLSKTDKEISSDLKRKNTYCSEVTRVYNGVGYDLCVLNARGNIVPIDNQLMLGFYAVDICASAVVDTPTLPFTMVSQSNYGSIPIVRK